MDSWFALSVGGIGLCVGLLLSGAIRFSSSPVVRPLLAVAVCGALWAVGDLINLHSRDLATDQIGVLVLYSGSTFLAPVWALLVLRWADACGSPLPPYAQRLWRLLMAWAGVMWLVMLTNPLHHRFLIPVVGGKNILLPLWWASAIPSYALVVGAAGAQLWVARRVGTPRVRRGAAVMIGVGLGLMLAYVLSEFWLPWLYSVEGMVIALCGAGAVVFTGFRLEEARRQFEEDLTREVELRTRQLDEANRELLDANRRLQGLQEQLLRAERLDAEEYLAGSIAHSINNPLTALKGRLEMALEEREGSDPALERILELACRIQEVVDGTLGLVRKKSLDLGVQTPATMLEEVREGLAERAAGRGVKIELKVSPNVPQIMVDRTLLVAALLGIAENSIDAMADRGGHLWLRAEEISTFGVPVMAFIIADSGPGIPADLRKRVFEPFFTTKRGGTGLGLAIARGVIQGHAGHVRIDDRSGGGALITVELPSAGDVG